MSSEHRDRDTMYSAFGIEIPPVQFQPPDPAIAELFAEETLRAQLPSRSSQKEKTSAAEFNADPVREIIFEITTDTPDMPDFEEGIVTLHDGRVVPLAGTDLIIFEKIATSEGLGLPFRDLSGSLHLTGFETARRIDKLQEKLDPDGGSPIIVRNPLPQGRRGRFAYSLHPQVRIAE